MITDADLARRALAGHDTAFETLLERQAILLHDLQGWKHREVAELLGISEPMSRRHTSDGRRALRERLEALERMERS